MRIIPGTLSSTLSIGFTCAFNKASSWFEALLIRFSISSPNLSSWLLNIFISSLSSPSSSSTYNKKQIIIIILVSKETRHIVVWDAFVYISTLDSQ